MSHSTISLFGKKDEKTKWNLREEAKNLMCILLLHKVGGLREARAQLTPVSVDFIRLFSVKSCYLFNLN